MSCKHFRYHYFLIVAKIRHEEPIVDERMAKDFGKHRESCEKCNIWATRKEKRRYNQWLKVMNN